MHDLECYLSSSGFGQICQGLDQGGGGKSRSRKDSSFRPYRHGIILMYCCRHMFIGILPFRLCFFGLNGLLVGCHVSDIDRLESFVLTILKHICLIHRIIKWKTSPIHQDCLYVKKKYKKKQINMFWLLFVLLLELWKGLVELKSSLFSIMEGETVCLWGPAGGNGSWG